MHKKKLVFACLAAVFCTALFFVLVPSSAAAQTLTVTLTVSPSSGTDPLGPVTATITLGGTATGGWSWSLNWDSNATPPNPSCFNPSGFVGSGNSFSPSATCTYTNNFNGGLYAPSVTVTREGITRTDGTTVQVSPAGSPPIVDLKVNGSDGPTAVFEGTSLNRVWTTSNSPTSCNRTGSWGGSADPAGGSSSITPGPGSYTYGITCTNSFGSDSDSVSVTVNPAPAVCSGTLNVFLNPTSAGVGDTVVAGGLGLNGCEGRTIAFHKGSPGGPLLNTCSVSSAGQGCNTTFTTVNPVLWTGSDNVFGKIDLNSDGSFAGAGEQDSAPLTFTGGGGFTVDVSADPPTINTNQSTQVTVTVGASATGFLTYQVNCGQGAAQNASAGSSNKTQTFNCSYSTGGLKTIQVTVTDSASPQQTGSGSTQVQVNTVGGNECGNGIIESPAEECDDGQMPPVNGGGCSATCQVEEGWTCTGQPSVCTNTGGGGSVSTPFTIHEDDNFQGAFLDVGANCDPNPSQSGTCEIKNDASLGALAGKISSAKYNPQCQIDLFRDEDFNTNAGGSTGRAEIRPASTGSQASSFYKAFAGTESPLKTISISDSDGDGLVDFSRFSELQYSDVPLFPDEDWNDKTHSIRVLNPTQCFTFTQGSQTGTCTPGSCTTSGGQSGVCNAQGTCVAGSGGGTPGGNTLPNVQVSFRNPINASSFTDLINRIIDFIFTIALIVAPILLVIAGVVFMTAVGDPGRVATARRMLLWTIIGFGVILISKGLVEVLKAILGI